MVHGGFFFMYSAYNFSAPAINPVQRSQYLNKLETCERNTSYASGKVYFYHFKQYILDTGFCPDPQQFCGKEGDFWAIKFLAQVS